MATQEEAQHTQQSPRRLSPQDEQLANFLLSLEMECYLDTFLRQNIDIGALAAIEDEQLKELGVSVGHRIKLRKAIEELKGLLEPEHRFEVVCKVIVVGDIGTGKTSLIQRYTQETFDKNYKATIGVDFCLKEISWNGNTTVSIQLWDIAGQERFANLTRMYYREARGAFVVFDITRNRTFEAVLKWKADIDAKVALPDGRPIPVVLLANKCDLAPPGKLYDFAEFCKTHGFEKWFLTSAKENIGIGEASLFLVEQILKSDDIGVRNAAASEFSHGLNVTNATPQQPSKKACCLSS